MLARPVSTAASVSRSTGQAFKEMKHAEKEYDEAKKKSAIINQTLRQKEQARRLGGQKKSKGGYRRCSETGELKENLMNPSLAGHPLRAAKL